MLTVTVDTLSDVVDGGDGLTSLREAIAAAPASGNQVAFHSSLNGGVIELSGQLTITQSISIAGPGASMLTVQAAPGSGRVFHVASNAANVSISGLTITGGGSDKGGGVLNWGTLTLDRVAVVGNKAAHFGGGVYSEGSLVIANSTIANNAAGWGGGVFGNLEGAESVYIYNSTIADNVADDGNAGTSNGQGGGIRVSIASAAPGASGFALINSTVSNNAAESSAGGVHVTDNVATKIRNSTITENSSGLRGGGLLNESASPILVQNTILAGNTATEAAFADGWGAMSGAFGLTSAYNIVGVTHASFGLSTLPGDLNQVGTATNPFNPKLSPLGHFGGATRTHVPLPGSLAIDHGANGYTEQVGGVYVDQRGSARLVDDLTVSNGNGNIVDVGAVEMEMRIGLGDFNGDGREDELRYSPTLRSLLVAEKGAISGGWEIGAWGSVGLATTPSPTSGNGVLVGDFNGDGRDDVMILEVDYSWQLGISDGASFHLDDLKPNGGPFTAGWAYAYVGDFDGDDDEELVGKVDGGTNWILIDYDRVTGTSSATTIALPGFAPGTQVFVQDVNRDGRADLITRANGSAPWMVNVSAGVSAGTLQFATAVDMDAWIDYGYHIPTGQLDADKAMAKVIEEFAWVYNNVELELYPGLMKGPTATEQTKAGNDWDQAALLEKRLQQIGLFSENNVKIASAKVRIDATHLAAFNDWLGVTSSTAAFNIINKSLDGKAVPFDANGGDVRTTHQQIAAIEFTHAWVKAYIPTATGMHWVDLDPSWKFKDRQAGVPLPANLDQIHTAQGLFDEFSFFGLNPASDHRLPVEFFEDQVMQWLATNSNPNIQGKSLAEVPYDGPIKTQFFRQLPTDYTPAATLAAVSEAADYLNFAAAAADPTLTHRVQIKLKKGATEFWSQDLVVPVVSLDAINVTFASSFGNVGNADSIAAPGSASYFGRLVVGGNVVQTAASNESFGPADKATLEILHLAPTRVTREMNPSDPKYVGPSTSDIKKIFTEKPGEIISLGLEANQHSRDSLAALQASILAGIASDTTETQLLQDVDALVSYTSAKYWYDFNRYNKIIAGLTGAVAVQQWVGSGLAKADPDLLEDAGSVLIGYLPFGMAPVNFGVDLPNINSGMYRTDTGELNAEAWQLVGYNSSALEHNVVEEIISAESVSTMKGLQRAYQGNLGVGPAVSGNPTPSASADVIRVFESRVTNGVRTVHHVYNVRSGSNNGVEVISTSGTALSKNNFENLLASHAAATGVDESLWDFLSGADLQLNGNTDTVTAMATRHRTDVVNWTGAVYVTEVPGSSMLFAIQSDGGSPSSGGFSGGQPQAPPPELPTGNFTYAGYAGDPVHTSNGNMFRDETDIVFPNIGVPLTFSRHYDSQSKDDVGMGVGWTYSFSDMLYLDEKGTSLITDDEIVWVAASGARHRFKKLSNGTYETPRELKGKLTRMATNEFVGATHKYVYVDPSGMEFHFQEMDSTINADPYNGFDGPHAHVGRLRIQRDSQGNGVQIQYTLTTIGHAFTEIRDLHDANRRLAFSYQVGQVNVDRISSIMKYDGGAAVGTWNYVYTDIANVVDSEKRLVSVSSPLVAVADGSYQESTIPTTVTYEYYNAAPGDPAYAKGMIKKITEADSSWHSYEYYRNGRTFRVKQGEVGQTPATAGVDAQTFSYNLFKNATEFTDERGNIESYFHQKNGLQEKQIHADRSQTKSTWGVVGAADEYQMKSTTDERGAVETFTYFTADDFKKGQLKTSTEKSYAPASALVTSYDYFQPASRPHMAALSTIIVDPGDALAGYQNLKTTNSYDSEGRLTSTTLPNGHDASGNPLPGFATTRTYYTAGDEAPAYRLGLLKSIKQPAILDPNDPNGLATVAYETIFDYDAAGNIVTSTTQNAATSEIVSTSTFTYDSAGSVTQTIIGANVVAERVVTESMYDVLGRLRETGFADANAAIDPYDAFTSKFKYDKSGRVRETRDPLGRITRFEYDRQGNVVKQINPDGSELLHKYDAFGNRTATTDALNRTTQFVYDDRNRLIQTLHQDGASELLRYDGAGNVTASIDALGNATTYKYDAVGRLAETKLPDPDGPNDEDGDGINLSSPTTTNKYDKLGNLIETIDPKGNVTQFKYDKLGRLVQTQTLNDPTGVNRNNQTPTTVTTLVSLTTVDYDAVGNVVETAAYDVSQYDAVATVTLLADPRAQQDLAPAKVQVVSTRYDAFGRPMKTINPDGTFTRSVYDAVGRVKYQYDELHGVNGASRETEYVYDAFGRLAQTRLPDPDGGSPEYTRPITNYAYDAVGNRIAVTDARGFTTRFEYDVFNRLASTTNPLGGRTRTTYDVAGQRVAAVDELGVANYTKYDDRGRSELQLSADPDGIGPKLPAVTRSRYDDAGRLIEQIDARGYSTTYAYDRLGRLTAERYVTAEVADDFPTPTSSFYVGPNATRTPATDANALGGDRTVLTGQGVAGTQTTAGWVFPNMPAGSYRIAITWSQLAGSVTNYTIGVGTISAALNDFNTGQGQYFSGVDQSKLPDDFTTDEGGKTVRWHEATANYVLSSSKILPSDNGVDLHIRLIGAASSTLQVDAVRIERIVENRFTYDANGNRLSETDARGNATTYLYDELDRVARTTLPDPDVVGTGLPTPRIDTTYDGYGNVVKENKFNNGGTSQRATTFEYDNRNRRLTETRDAGVDAPGSDFFVNQRTKWQYDAAGNLLERQELTENVATPGTFDLQRRTTYAYDALDRLWRETFNSDGNDNATTVNERVTVTHYDAAGNVVKVEQNPGADLRQLATLYQVDALGRPIEQTEQGLVGGATQKRTTRFLYDAVGNQTAMIDPLSRLSRSEYDRLGRLVKATDPDPDGAGTQPAVVTTYQYDAAGNLIAESNGANQTDRFVYDSRGLLVRTTDGRGDETIRRYDAVGNLVALVDPAQNVTTYRYDGLDRLKTETILVDGLPQTRAQEYDALGRLSITVDRNGRATEYGYDRLDRVISEKWYVDRAAANLPNNLDYSDITSWAFDALGRIQSQAYIRRTGSGSSYVNSYRVVDTTLYDGLDRAIEKTSQSSSGPSLTPDGPALKQTYAYAYDATGLTETREQFIAGLFAAQTRSTYNAFGELVRQIDSENNGSASSAILDFEGTDTVFSYLGDGALAKTERFTDDNSPPGYLNRIQTNYAYDGAGRLKLIGHNQSRRTATSWPANTQLLALDYAYDNAGRINFQGTDWNTSLTAFSTRTDETQTFDFDGAGQLTYVDSSLTGADAGYNYSANGNRTSASEPVGGNDSYQMIANNRVSSDSTYTYEYDAEGNLIFAYETSDPGQRLYYTWDHRNRLVKVSELHGDHEVLIVNYRYNEAGDLVYRQVDRPFGTGLEPAEHYLVESGQRVLAFEQDGDVKRRYQYGPTGEVLFDQVFDATGNPTLQAEQDLLIPLSDHQHSTRVVLAHAGDDSTYVRQSLDYAQFGRVTTTLGANGLADTSGSVTVFGHHGSVADAATGLQLKGERWYSPDLGRFVSEDPIQDGANWYMFAGNDPVNYADPSGLSMQGYPLGGGFSGNVTMAPTIHSGSIPANNLGLGPALSPLTNNFIKGAVNQANAYQRATDQAIERALAGGGVFDQAWRNQPVDTTGKLFQAVRLPPTPSYVTPPTEIQRLIDSNAQRGVHVVDERILGGVSYGDILVRNDVAAFHRDIATTNSVFEAFAGTLFSPVASAFGRVAGGAVDAILPQSEPSRYVVFSDGTTATGLGGGPASGAMWEQGIALATMAGPKVPGIKNSAVPLASGAVAESTTAESSVSWNNGWRTSDGKFATPQGTTRAGGAAESATWDAVEAKPGWQVIRGEVSVRDASGQLRKYDGAAISPKGRVIGLEVKSGTGARTAAQRKFDSALNSSGVETLPTVGRHSGLQIRRSIEVRK